MRAQSFSRIYLYSAWLMGGFLLWLFSKSGLFSHPLIFSLGFFYILFLPGFSASRLLKLENLSFTARLLLYFVLGLGFYFVVGLLAIFGGISLSLLSPILIILLVLLLTSSFLIDLLMKESEPQKINKFVFFRLRGAKIKYQFNFYYLFYILALIIALFVLWVVYLKGPNLNGDPYYHLAIIKKALEGDALSSRSLAFTKTSLINPTYVYPVWQVFLAFLGRIFSLDIFSVWQNNILPLTVISFFSWYYLAETLFKKKFLVILSYLIWLILVFYDGSGYLFTRLGVPDTLAQLILLPLGLALTFKYVFEKKPRNFLIVNFLIALMLLAIHGPHYFYLLLAVFAYALFYAAVYFKEKDYKLILTRLLKVFLIELSVLIIVGILMEIRSRTISATIFEFNKLSEATIAYSSFFKFSLVYKYAFFLIPIVFVFSRPHWWLVSINMLLIPLIYFTSLKDFFSRFLSIVFTDRLLSNLAWYFFVFSIVLALIMYFVDFSLNHLKEKVRIITNILLSFIFLILIIFEIKNQAISDFTYKILYAKETNAFVNTHYLWFILIPILIAIAILIIKILKKEFHFFYQESQSNMAVFLLTLIISWALITPSLVNVSYFLKQPKIPSGEDYFLVPLQNDRSALNYLKTQIPQKSVVLAIGGASKSLAVLSNQYMAYNAGSAYEKKFDWVFDGENPDTGKAEIVTSSKWAIDYIYLENPALENSHFKMHPELYQLVYKSKTTEIYQVIK